MRCSGKTTVRLLAALTALLAAQCASVPEKSFYILNYEPEALADRRYGGPYPYVIRVKTFDIEEAYARPQIVYRKSPFELQYYFYRVWAVQPEDMFTDLIDKHLTSVGLVSQVVRRFDEGSKPDYELSGTIEALEEYDSDEVWFAHLAFRIRLVRLSDARTVYMRRFDSRKQVFQKSPEYVVRELSRILDILMNQAIHDMDQVLAREYGVDANAEGGNR
jgi:ABC-type uncharacterized transport system auxiliary subunit